VKALIADYRGILQAEKNIQEQFEFSNRTNFSDFSRLAVQALLLRSRRYKASVALPEYNHKPSQASIAGRWAFFSYDV